MAETLEHRTNTNWQLKQRDTNYRGKDSWTCEHNEGGTDNQNWQGVVTDMWRGNKMKQKTATQTQNQTFLLLPL